MNKMMNVCSPVLLLVVMFWFQGILGHSWMTCPPSFNPRVGRGGIQGGVCEGEYGTLPVTEVEAGDRLKIGWVSNNHGGGLARISLVPWEERRNAQSYKDNVMKFACYGHDERPRRYQTGQCMHPCNARPGCEYQSDPEDVERYDTTIAIPTNLRDGFYSLQVAMLVGNGGVYNSCGKIKVFGGNPNFSCRSSKKPVTNKCKKAAGPPFSRVLSGTKRGDFCYGLDGSIGTVDDYMEDVPINVDCDPRASCKQTVSVETCERNFPSMLKIITPDVHPRQPNCPVYKVMPVFH